MTLPWLGLLIAALAVPLLGLALLALGLRGRLADSLSYCRRCRFCVEGIAPTTCPECGGDLAAPRAIRVGRRRKLRSLVAVGATLLLIGLVGLGAIGWGRATAFNWNTIKPVWLLETDARSANLPTATGAWTELARRAAAGDLAGPTVDRLVDEALARQRNPNAAWTVQIGDYIEAARAKRRITDERWYEYQRSGITLSTAVRPVIRAGSSLPYRITAGGGRLGSSGSFIVGVGDLTVRSADGRILASRGPSGYMGMSRAGGSSMAGTVPADLPAGDYSGEIALTLNLHAGYDGTPLDTWTVEYPLDFSVIAGDTVLLAPPPGPAVDAAVRASLSVVQLSVESFTQGEAEIYLQISSSGTPVDCSFDIFAVVAGQEIGAGSAVFHAASLSSLGTGATIPGLTGDRLTLILRTNKDRAEQTVDLTSVWDGEIVFRDLPIERADRLKPSSGSGTDDGAPGGGADPPAAPPAPEPLE